MSIKAVKMIEIDGNYDPNLKGDLKLSRAVSYVMSWLESKYPTLNTSKYIEMIESTIESILSTPQKKDSK